MKIIICDNCGEKGQENRVGELCEKCMVEWQDEHVKVMATKNELDLQLKKKFNIR